MKNVYLAGLFCFGMVVGWAAKPGKVPDPPESSQPRSIEWPKGPDGTPWTNVVLSPDNLLYETERKYEDEKARRVRAEGNLMDLAARQDASRSENDRLRRELAHWPHRMEAERRLWRSMTYCRTCGPKCECGIWCQCSKEWWVASCTAAPRQWPAIPPARVWPAAGVVEE